MSFGFNDFQKSLSSWPEFSFSHEQGSDSILERIRQILVDAEGGILQTSDFLPLIRHLLLRESMIAGESKKLRVSASSPWPSRTEWAAHGISAMTIGTEGYLLSAEPWSPVWLGDDGSGVFSDIYSDRTVRVDEPCESDPFITDVTGYTHYSSPGQRESVRAAFLIPPGDTLIVNLPTGAGKSLVGQAPALVNNQDGNLTLFVVPTVGLAIDQARRMAEYFQNMEKTNNTWPLAWYGGQPDAERVEIRSRLRNGNQRLLFTSPEALTTSLLKTIFDVARNGMLSYLVIDEAHLITQWGDSFRPAFQALAGLRNSLLLLSKEQPFRTLLLSATFTPETIDTLANLFGPPDRVQMVSAVHLRPEPQYWFYQADSFEEKTECVLEALRYAPRPFILYVTKRTDANFWLRTLKKFGYNRIEQFDGATPSQKRIEIIDSWAKNELDGVVATSAFGVGIDKSDVRTVIHATIPETLDRFYQEVGRGGREGKPSISLLIYDNSDWKLPEQMAAPKIISDELGFSRWKAMYNSRQLDEASETFTIDIGSVRQGLLVSNDENEKWNMRTLLLMARAGFLNILVEPNGVVEDQADEFSHASFQAAMSVVKIKLLRNDHGLPDVWEKVISPARNRTKSSAKRSLRLMRKILEGDGKRGEVSEALAELYSNDSTSWPVTVTKVCGGCPADRFSKYRNDRYHVPIPAPVHQICKPDISQWNSTFHYLSPECVVVFYDPKTAIHLITNFIKWLVSNCEIKELSIDENWYGKLLPDFKELYRYSPSKVLIQRYHHQLDEEPYTELPRVTIFDESVSQDELQKALLIQRPLHLILCPSGVRDPYNSRRVFSETMLNSQKLNQLIAVINQ